MSATHQQVDDNLTLLALDVYYASLLNCQLSALRDPGWTALPSRDQDDPMTQLFGMRQVVYLVVPIARGRELLGQAGIATLAPELRAQVGKLLSQTPPQHFFRRDTLASLDALVRGAVDRPLVPGCQSNLRVSFTTTSRFRRYLGVWVELIERMDETVDSAPFTLALLAGHSGGVFAVRVKEAILAYIGLRTRSNHICELTEPRLTKHAPPWLAARPGELYHALISCATRAALSEGRIPICITAPNDKKLRRALAVTGYHPYARASAYAVTA